MRTLVVAKRVAKMIFADKRSIGLMFVAPVFVIYLLSVILNSAVTKPDIEIVSAPKAFVDILQKNANVSNAVNEHEAINDLKNGKADAYVVFSGNAPSITLEGANPSVTGLVMDIVMKAQAGFLPSNAMPINASAVKRPEIKLLYGSKDMTAFDFLAPLLMGFFIFFFVFLIAGVAFLRERISGTLERILATPLRRSEIVKGYFIGFGLFVAVQTIVIQLFTMYGLNVVMKGSFWLVLLINIILAGQSLALGTLLSSFARNEFQLFQFIPIVIVPQILFSGIFDLREAPQWVDWLSRIFPLTYAADALRDVMIRGLGFAEIQFNIYILITYTVGFLILNTLVLKKHRKT